LVRTTVTLDDDIAIRLERLSQEQGRSFKAVINEVLRMGLDSLQRVPHQRTPSEQISYTQPLPGNMLLTVEQAIEVSEEDYLRNKMGS
jgi:hypothetical protein